MDLFPSFPIASPWIRVLSTSNDGPMPTSTGLSASPWRSNRERFLQQHNVNQDRLVTARLAHGTHILPVSRVHGGTIIESMDGLSTNIPELFLTITAADCLPVYFFDPVHHAIGLTHAGRRGLAAGILPSMVRHMRSYYTTDPSQLIVGVGPGICVRHYAVPDEVAEVFDHMPNATEDKDGLKHLNLNAVARHQLLASGVSGEHILFDERCTFEDATLFSLRRDGDLDTGVMIALAGIRVST